MLLASSVPPLDVRRPLLSAVESLRLVSATLQPIIDADDDDDDDFGSDAAVHVQALVDIVVGRLEEMVGGCFPDVPDRVFVAIKSGELGWSPSASPGMIRASLAFELARRAINRAIDAADFDDDDLATALLGARELIEIEGGVIDCLLVGGGGVIRPAVDAILAGRPVPSREKLVKAWVDANAG